MTSIELLRVMRDGMKPGTKTGQSGTTPARWEVDEAGIRALADRVRQHFDEHKPEPTSFPETAARVMDVAEHPEVDIGRLAHLIERDPALAAAVLGVANSAAYRRAVPVQAVRGAMTLLGLRRVANLAVGVACRTLFDVEARVQHDLYPQWWHRLFHAAMTEAFAASFVGMDRNPRASDAIFLAGMFHDIGKPLALRSLSSLLVSGALPGIPSDDAIEGVLQATHVEIGVTAQRTWSFPESLIETCSRQNDASVPAGPAWIDTHVVRLVSTLNDVRMGAQDVFELQRTLLDSARALGLGRDDLLVIARQVKEHAEQVALLFSITDGANEAGYMEWVTTSVPDGPA